MLLYRGEPTTSTQAGVSRVHVQTASRARASARRPRLSGGDNVPHANLEAHPRSAASEPLRQTCRPLASTQRLCRAADYNVRQANLDTHRRADGRQPL